LTQEALDEFTPRYTILCDIPAVLTNCVEFLRKAEEKDIEALLHLAAVLDHLGRAWNNTHTHAQPRLFELLLKEPRLLADWAFRGKCGTSL
jgi:hypothetical protein